MRPFVRDEGHPIHAQINAGLSRGHTSIETDPAYRVTPTCRSRVTPTSEKPYRCHLKPKIGSNGTVALSHRQDRSPQGFLRDRLTTTSQRAQIGQNCTLRPPSRLGSRRSRRIIRRIYGTRDVGSLNATEPTGPISPSASVDRTIRVDSEGMLRESSRLEVRSEHDSAGFWTSPCSPSSGPA
jgi:hypothetical protein